MGYHRHELFEDIPTGTLVESYEENGELDVEYDPSMLFGIRFGTEPTTDQKMALMRRVLQKPQPNRLHKESWALI